MSLVLRIGRALLVGGCLLAGAFAFGFVATLLAVEAAGLVADLLR